MIKVHNPHPRLVNVALGNGKFTRIIPGGTAEVDQKLVQRLLDSKELERASGAESSKDADQDDAAADAKAKAEAAAAAKNATKK